MLLNLLTVRAQRVRCRRLQASFKREPSASGSRLSAKQKGPGRTFVRPGPSYFTFLADDAALRRQNQGHNDVQNDANAPEKADDRPKNADDSGVHVQIFRHTAADAAELFPFLNFIKPLGVTHPGSLFLLYW